MQQTRAASATVLSMLVAALLLSALAFHFNRTVERPMNALAETARAVALGNLDVRAKVDGPLEVATVAREFNEMLDARARADAEARALSAALEESREQLQRLAAGLLLAREEERTTIAREIHDVLGQTLTALKMDVAWIGRRLPDDMPAIGREAGGDGDAHRRHGRDGSPHRHRSQAGRPRRSRAGGGRRVAGAGVRAAHRHSLCVCAPRSTTARSIRWCRRPCSAFFRSRSPTWRGTAARRA